MPTSGRVLLTVAALACTCFAQDKPNFSGTWKLDLGRSDFGPSHYPFAQTDVIEQSGQTIRISIAFDAKEEKRQYTVTLVTDGKEIDAPEDVREEGVTLQTDSTSWDGNVLVVHHKETYRSNTVTSVSRYTLSSDGRVFTLIQDFNSQDGNMSRTLVFDRADLATPGTVDTTPVSPLSAKTKEPDMTIFGLNLGEKFSLPECKRGQAKDFPYGFEFASTPFICFQRGDVRTTMPNAPIGTGEVGIRLPDDDTPLGVMYHVVATENNRRAAIVAQIVDGNIEAVTIYTMGIRFQDTLLAMLSEKYGKPSRFEEENKENSFGAVFSSHLAEWSQFANLMVTFEGTLDRTDIGSIDIMTVKGANYRAEKAKQKIRARPKM